VSVEPSHAGTARALRARNLRTVLALAGLFFVPLIGSFWLYYGASWRPSGHTNHGELIEPVRPLPRTALPVLLEKVAPDSPDELTPEALAAAAARADLFVGRWSLVYIGNGACDAACRRALYVMRQTRVALNNDMTRVQRIFLVTAGCCDQSLLRREYPGLLLADASAAPALLERFPASQRTTSVFVVDPLGNLMMRYDARRNPRGLLDDLKKLLQLSHIG